MQDLYAFCAYALLLQICIFMLFVSKASQYAHSTEDTLQRVLNVFIAAVPVGAPTGEAWLSFACFMCFASLLGRRQGLADIADAQLVHTGDINSFLCPHVRHGRYCTR